MINCPSYRNNLPSSSQFHRDHAIVNHFAVFKTCSSLTLLKYSSCLAVCSFWRNEWYCSCLKWCCAIDSMQLAMSCWLASIWHFITECNYRNLKLSSKDLNSSWEMYCFKWSGVWPPIIGENILGKHLSSDSCSTRRHLDAWLAGPSSWKCSQRQNNC